MSKILILGGTGMLGHKLVQVLGAESDFDVHCTVRARPDGAFRHERVTYHEGVDVGTGSGALAPLFDRVAPDFVINAIGAIKQKDLYAEIDRTFYLNGTLPHLIPLLAGSNTRLIHLSTDCVFRGDRGNYTETDSPDVEDLYGRSKACGEVSYGQHLTLRTSIIGFEAGGHLGLISWFLSQPRGSTLRGFTEAIYSGLPTVTLSRTIVDVIRHPQLQGLWHVASEPITKFDLLARLNDALDLRHELVPDASLRMDRSLDDGRFRAATGTVRPDWGSLIAELVEDYQSRPYQQLYHALRAARPPVLTA